MFLLNSVNSVTKKLQIKNAGRLYMGIVFKP